MSGAAERLAEHAAQNRGDDSEKNDSYGLADSALQGVSVSFLAQVFYLDPAKVKRRLVNCPIKHTRKRGKTQTQHLYDLATAAEYLVEPKVDPDELIKKLRPSDLPPAINTAYWDAQLKRQTWEERAGKLWRTEMIRSVIGGMFQTIKFTIQLWGDTIERQTGLSEKQRDVLNTMTDKLQAEMFDSLQENAKAVMTGPQLSELESMLSMARSTEDGDDLDDDALRLI